MSSILSAILERTSTLRIVNDRRPAVSCKTLDEVEYYVGKLKRERRDGHLLVPRRLVQVNRKLMKFCREQANKAVEYNYRMASADRKYTMKHGFYMMFNLYDKKEQLLL